jgi:hypothetical protein
MKNKARKLSGPLPKLTPRLNVSLRLTEDEKRQLEAFAESERRSVPLAVAVLVVEGLEKRRVAD